MTKKGAWLPPRWFIEAFWRVHRRVVRASGGRRGLHGTEHAHGGAGRQWQRPEQADGVTRLLRAVGGVAFAVAVRPSAGEASTLHDQIFFADRTAFEEAFQYLANPGRIARLGR